MTPRRASLGGTGRSPDEKVPPIVAFSGASGAGKTRLLMRLIPALAARGLRVAALKHTAHRHLLDVPGTDSQRLRRAGALAVAVQGPDVLALHAPARADVRALADLLGPVDLVLAEGFKREALPRVEVHRRRTGGPFLCATDPDVLAVVSDEVPPADLPRFRPAQVDALAAFLIRRLGLADLARPPPTRGRGASTHRPRRGGAPIPDPRSTEP